MGFLRGRVWFPSLSNVISMIPRSTIWSTKNHYLFRGPVGHPARSMSEAGAGRRTRPIKCEHTVKHYCFRGGLQLPNFSENPNNVRKWVGGVNACSDWKCLTLDNFGQFSKVQWLSRSVLLEVKNLCLLSISRSVLLLEARGRWGLRINVDLPWPAQSIRPFNLACSRFTCQRH